MPIAGPLPQPSRRAFLAGVLGAGAVGVAGCSPAEAPSGGRPIAVPQTDPDRTPGAGRRQPDLVVIVSDDHRWDHVGFNDDRPPFLETPNLDRLAARGVVAENAFVTTALCSPSRGTFLSGQYATRHGVQNNLTAWNPETRTFFEPLMAAGYDCAFIGKWHMPGQLPDLRGVNTFITFTAEEGQGQYIDCPLLIDGVMTERPGTYITEDLTSLAIDWIDSRPPDRPYALWLAHKAVHHQFIPPAKFSGALADADLGAFPPESFTFQSLMDENVWEGTLGTLPAVYRRYCETLLGLDDQVGRLMDHVDDSGRGDNTYIVYSSDNGYSWGEHVLTGKRWAFEENTRVPFIAAGPGIPAGSTTDELIVNADLAPTLIEWAGAEPLPDAQGRSLVALLDGDDPKWRDEFMYEYFPDFPYHVPGLQAVRDDRWLYVEYESGPEPQLFDIQADPRTQNDLATAEPDRVRELSARLAELRTTVGVGGSV